MFVARSNEFVPKQGGDAKFSQVYSGEYVQDDFVPTTQQWTIAADRSRIRISNRLIRINNFPKNVKKLC